MSQANEANARRVTGYMATTAEVERVKRAAKASHRTVAQFVAMAVRAALAVRQAVKR